MKDRAKIDWRQHYIEYIFRLFSVVDNKRPLEDNGFDIYLIIDSIDVMYASNMFIVEDKQLVLKNFLTSY